MNTATTRSVPSKTSASSPCTSRLISETLSMPMGSLRTTSITWSSRVPAHHCGVLRGVQRQIRLVGGYPDHLAALPVGQRQVHLPAIGHRREGLADLGHATLLLAEGLRAGDGGQGGIVVLAGDAGRVLGVDVPVNVPELTGGHASGLGDEGDIAQPQVIARVRNRLP